jgi:polyribonucleotide nucleotidyltransferase
MKIVKKSLQVCGRTLTLETGRFAQQATSSVLATYGDTTVFAVVTMGQEDKKKDYFPLSVEYQERLYAGGRIRGSRWVKREGRATDAETLAGRLIDRSIRPLFPKSFRRDVQLVVMVLSTDKENDADILGAIASSAVLGISPLPWKGPISTVRVGYESEELTANPKNGNRQGTDLDLVVSSTKDLITMIEAGAKQVPEDTVLQALELGFKQNQEIVSFINEFIAEAGLPKLEIKFESAPKEVIAAVKEKSASELDDFISKAAFHEGDLLSELSSTVSADFDETQKPFVSQILEDLIHERIRTNILEKKQRPDGRKFDEIRSLSAEVKILPRVHGSAVFQRGQTQALTITTLGAPSLSQSLESAEGEETKRYMHHYNFPPFSTGETGRMGMPSRREIGHGALAEKALAPVIPPETEFPYAIRLVSEIMSSNGSTSMASTCGSTLSLMDAGVPIKAPVAGISIGLITPASYPEKTDKYVLLTDIIGMEDHHGDMDFKVAGTKDGVTAIQLDVKVPGLTLDICKETFVRSKTARMQVLDIMLKAIPESRKELSEFAPKISMTTIPVDKIGELIGPGGKNIKQLMADTGTVIDVNDDGSVFISGIDPEGTAKALNWVAGLGKEAIPGEIYEGTVARIQPFGAFVNILPGKDGLVHVSQMASGFVQDPSQIVSEGQKVKVWVTEIDSQGRINLSMLFDADGNPVAKAREQREFDSRPPHRDPFQAPRRMDSRGGNSRKRFQ